MLFPLLLLACASDEPVWAVANASMRPTSNGVEGVQGWSFFTRSWGNGGEGAFVCTRAQSFTGEVVAAIGDCEGCLAAYELTYTELGSDCDDGIAADPAYQLPVTMGIGDALADYADLDPEPDRSFGWYADLGAGLEPYGFAWDSALDWGGETGPPGWNQGQVYTLQAVIAWDIKGG